jgi:superfamily II DNA or RNA helicase
VENLIAFLGRESVAVRLFEGGFLHAKCYLFYGDQPQSGWERLRPLVGIVGSSNFTVPGLTSNRELNLAHKTLLSDEEIDAELANPPWVEGQVSVAEGDLSSSKVVRGAMSRVGARAIAELDAWFQETWGQSRDFKEELIEILDSSKFGTKEYTPYQIYMKALYEYFKDDLEKEELSQVRSAVELAEFQEDAVKKARKILTRHNGVMIADSVGLGKTWIGKKLLEDYAYHRRQKALVICPASLRNMWEKELREAAIAATIISQEELGREEFNPAPHGDADVILIDESHNFRNRNAQRYLALEKILGYRGGRGRDGLRKKLMLLTATPINNDLIDLYNQLSLITMGDRSYFSTCGIGDLHRYFLRARREVARGGDSFPLFNLLEEVVIRRTRAFIRRAYPEATISGERIHFPERKLRTINYNLEATYEGIYEFVVSGIENLHLAPYNLEAYKKAGVQVDEFEAGREQALVGIFKSRYLKRFESSIEAFRISVKRALSFLKTFESYLLDGKLLKSTDFQKALRYLAREEEEDDATPSSLAEEIDESEEAGKVLESMETIDPSDYDLRRLHDAVQHDVDILTEIWARIRDIGPENDVKLQRLKGLLKGDLRGKKVLIFSYFKDTARYLYNQLGKRDNPEAQEFMRQLGEIAIRRMDSDASPQERQRIIEKFSPLANRRPDLAGSDEEINILISTDVLSEGQNLQDCGYLVNYDLHWNPTRMVQRAGRIDRIGTKFDTLWIYNMFPDKGLERLLGLVESLNRKIAEIDSAGFLDASVLGEAVHPKNFNTLRRIREEDGSVIEEEEEFAELASGEFLLQGLKDYLEREGLEAVEQLPDGIHYGLVKEEARGVFFYFKAQRAGQNYHFWRFYDLRQNEIVDNRFLIANLISCERDTPRVVDPQMFASVFKYQDAVIEDILQSVQRQRAMEVAPRTLDPVQQNVIVALQEHINDPGMERSRIVKAIKALNQPMLTVQIKKLRGIYRSYQTNPDVEALLLSIEELGLTHGGNDGAEKEADRED